MAQSKTVPQGIQRWATRPSVMKTVLDPAKASGLLLASPTGDAVVPLSPGEQDEALRLTRTTLAAAGLRPGDRVVVSLNNDGNLAGARIAWAAGQISEAAVATGPRGRMRLLRLLESVRANVLIATPTGAADFLARLHMEFLVDPLDLELRLLLLTGEIANDKTRRHLAAEFGAEVAEVYTEPLTGIPVAHCDSSRRLVLAEPGVLALAAVDRDEVLDQTAPGVRGELVACHRWHAELGSVAVRTGHVTETGDGGALLAPAHTIGDGILVRGQWLSLTAVTTALHKIDGITHWRFEVSRKGTLDSALLTVSFNRESLIRNGMWKTRIEQAITALTPVTVNVAVDQQVREETAPPEIVDQRGQHLGTDRE